MADASEVAAASIEVQMSASRAESAIVGGHPVDFGELDRAVEAFKAVSVEDSAPE